MTEEELAAAAAAETEVEEDAADLWAEFDELDAGGPAADAIADDGAQAGEAGDVADADVVIATDAAGLDGTDGAGPTLAAPQPDTGASSAWATAPEELRTEFEKLREENAKLLQKERSASGRATGFQRRYEELVKAAQPRTAGGDRPSPQAALDALKDDYPEIAEPLAQALGAIQGDVATLAAAEESRRTAAQTELTDYIDNETTSLKSQHPDYLDVLAKNSDRLVAWIDDQPRAVRDAFARNANDIVNAAEAAKVIGLFKAHLGMPADVPASGQPQTPAADPLASRRSRQLGATANLTKANRRPTVSGIPENGDPQAIWDAFDEAERR